MAITTTVMIIIMVTNIMTTTSTMTILRNLPDRAMRRIMLKSKIHRAILTGKALDYEGSIALDRQLMGAADLLPGEQVHVLNVNTGARLVTYAIEAAAGSGTVMLNGPAARLGEVGDRIIIIAYGHYENTAARRLKPRIVHVNEQNIPVTPAPRHHQ